MNISKRLLAVSALSALVSSSAMAHEAGSWIFRAGIGTVAPDSDNLVLPDFPAAGIVSTVEVDDGTSLTLSGTYMFTPNWAFDILASWPFSHDIDLTVVDTGPSGSTTSLKIGETDHLPPTFSVQYHFLPDAVFQPYVGAGFNYTTLFNTDVTAELTDLLGVTSLDLDDSFGLALQLGADWNLDNNWLINFDLRYIDIETDAEVSDGTTTAEVGTVAIDPYVFAINVGYRF
jgi:outer membrane protein